MKRAIANFNLIDHFSWIFCYVFVDEKQTSVRIGIYIYILKYILYVISLFQKKVKSVILKVIYGV